jgi:hypothetical protein
MDLAGPLKNEHGEEGVGDGRADRQEAVVSQDEE